MRRRDVAPLDAIAGLQRLEIETPRHPLWLATFCSPPQRPGFAILLGADSGATATAAVSTGLGLPARQALHRRQYSVLAMPFAALIGGLLGGLAIRLGWTATPELALIVPALMLVPGPHLINGIFDLIDNFVPMSLARLTLASGILLANSLGVLAGVELTALDLMKSAPNVAPVKLTLATDMLLAGVVTCGFAAYYNASWRQIGLAAVGGMVGHGLRFLAPGAGWGLVWAHGWRPGGRRRRGVDYAIGEDACRGHRVCRRRHHDARHADLFGRARSHPTGPVVSCRGLDRG